MPDWSKEIRAAIATLNLEPTREAEVVEELSQHLRDRYEDMLAAGISAQEARQTLLRELSDGKLVAGLKATVQAEHLALPLGRDGDERPFARIWPFARILEDLRYGARLLLRRSRLCNRGDSLAGTWHWCEYGHLPITGCGAFAHFARTEPGAAGGSAHRTFTALLHGRFLLRPCRPDWSPVEAVEKTATGIFQIRAITDLAYQACWGILDSWNRSAA